MQRSELPSPDELIVGTPNDEALHYSPALRDPVPVKENFPGRTLAIGDIHGCLTALDTLLDAVAPGSDDRLITLGDYVDRGANSPAVLDRLLELETATQLVPLLGNHEEMMLTARGSREAFADWLRCGGRETMLAYPGDEAISREEQNSLRLVPSAHWQLLGRCREFFETDTHFFVHANADPKYPLNRQSSYMLRWMPFVDPAPHYSGKVMVCGHTSQSSGLPKALDFAVCIDTWVYGCGWLTCLDVVSGKIWQANEKGAMRTLTLSDLELH